METELEAATRLMRNASSLVARQREVVAKLRARGLETEIDLAESVLLTLEANEIVCLDRMAGLSWDKTTDAGCP
jgi:hypothetical protein